MTDSPTSRRGRTAAGRLRALDEFVVARERDLLLHGQGAFIDVGFGDEPVTTVASASAFRSVCPGLEVIGVERDRGRVERARAMAPLLRFEEGDFAALPAFGPARLIRVMNVLRGYREEDVPVAHAWLERALSEGGVALEGSSDPSGGLLTAHVLRRRGSFLVREALLFFCSFEAGFAPMQFRDWLPRDLRRRVKPGAWIHAFLADWTAAWDQTRGPHRDAPERAFSAAAERLAQVRDGVVQLGAGMLLCAPGGGVPA